MGIFSAIYDYWQKENLKQLFFDICKNNDLKLDYSLNSDSIEILKEIFFDRCYSDYFPFYSDSVVVDIGAHKGYFSLFAAKNLSKNSKIISYEPIPENYQTMKTNLKENHIENVKIYNQGIYSENKSMDIYLSKSINHSLFQSYNQYLNQENQNKITVQCISLEQIFKDNNLETIDFLKIDTEGAEYPIVFTASKEIMNRIKVISMEFHDLKTPENSGIQLINSLKKNGFEIVKFNHEPTKINNNFGKIIAINSKF